MVEHVTFNHGVWSSNLHTRTIRNFIDFLKKIWYNIYVIKKAMQYKLLTRVSINKFAIQNCPWSGSPIAVYWGVAKLVYGTGLWLLHSGVQIPPPQPSCHLLSTQPRRHGFDSSTTPNDDQGAAHRDMVTQYGALVAKRVIKVAK